MTLPNLSPESEWTHGVTDLSKTQCSSSPPLCCPQCRLPPQHVAKKRHRPEEEEMQLLRLASQQISSYPISHTLSAALELTAYEKDNVALVQLHFHQN